MRYVYTGNVHDEEGGSTYCHQCGEKLIGSDWYVLSGDPTARENAILVADYYDRTMNNYDFTNTRTNGWHLLLTLAMFVIGVVTLSNSEEGEAVGIDTRPKVQFPATPNALLAVTEDLRGLEFLDPVEITVLSPEDLAARVAADIAEEIEHNPFVGKPSGFQP